MTKLSISTLKIGSLVCFKKKDEHIGIVVEVFGDLDPSDPWVKILFTHPKQGNQWCKMSVLREVTNKKGDPEGSPLIPTQVSGS